MTRSHYKEPEFSLSDIAIFANLSADALERIQKRCSWRTYAPGEPIVEYLDDSDDVFFIAVDEVRVTLYSTTGKMAPAKCSENIRPLTVAPDPQASRPGRIASLLQCRRPHSKNCFRQSLELHR